MSSKNMFYILKRVLLAILTIWIVITITFFVMHAVPGGPFVGEKAVSEAAQAALEQSRADADAMLTSLANDREKLRRQKGQAEKCKRPFHPQ